MHKFQRTMLVLFFSAFLTAPALGQHCGTERWSVKTGTDATAAQVDLSHPQDAKIADLVKRQPPSPLPTDTRFSPTEDTVFVVNATLTDFKVESGSTGDSDYHLVLQDEQGNTMVAEIPAPTCVGASSLFANQITAARSNFDAHLTPKSPFQTANVPVRVTGVGFFDFFHHQHGAAPNVIELHPVLDIAFNPGPATGDFSFTLSSAALHLQGGSSSSVGITVGAVAGGAAPHVAFTVSGLPAGITSQVATGTSEITTLTFNAQPGATNGTFPAIVTGSANGLSHSQALAVSVSSQPAGSEVQHWEYKMVSATSEQDVVDQASQLGKEGWEMVSVVGNSGSPAWRAFFKRPTKD